MIDFLDRSYKGQSFWIEDGGMPNLLGDRMTMGAAKMAKGLDSEELILGIQKFLRDSSITNNVMPWFAQGVDAADGVLSLKRPWWQFGFGSKKLQLKWDITKSLPLMNAIVDMHKDLSKATGGTAIIPPGWTLSHDLITPHPLGRLQPGQHGKRWRCQPQGRSLRLQKPLRRRRRDRAYGARRQPFANDRRAGRKNCKADRG